MSGPPLSLFCDSPCPSRFAYFLLSVSDISVSGVVAFPLGLVVFVVETRRPFWVLAALPQVKRVVVSLSP